MKRSHKMWGKIVVEDNLYVSGIIISGGISSLIQASRLNV